MNPYFNRRRAPTSPTTQFLDSYLPSLVALGSIALPIVYHFYEKYKGYKSLSYEIRAQLQDDNQEKRNRAVNILLNSLKTEKASSSNELHYNENAAAAYDFGFYDILYKQAITKGDEQSDEFIDMALQCMRKMIKAEKAIQHKKRHQILKKYGVGDLFQLTIKDEEDSQMYGSRSVASSSLALLRTLTRFDRFRRWTIDDVPNGSQGCVLLQYIPEDDWKTFLLCNVNTNDVAVQKNAAAVVAHASEYPVTAHLLNQANAVANLVTQLHTKDRDTDKKILVSISKLFEEDPARSYDKIFRPTVINDIMRLASDRRAAFDSPPDTIAEHSIMLILYTLSRYLVVHGDRQKRAEFTSQLASNANSMITILMLSESMKQSCVKQFNEFMELISSPEWSDNHTILLALREQAEKELVRARIEFKKQEAKKKMEMQKKMMAQQLQQQFQQQMMEVQMLEMQQQMQKEQQQGMMGMMRG